MATGRRTGQPSPVRRGTIAMLTTMSPTTGANTARGRRAPLARETFEGGQASPSRLGAWPAPNSRLPPSLETCASLRRQDEVRLQREPARRRHCSHAYLDKALVIRGEAIVTSRRQDPQAVGPASRPRGRQPAGPTSRRAPMAGGEAGEHRHRRLGPAPSRITIVPLGGRPI